MKNKLIRLYNIINRNKININKIVNMYIFYDYIIYKIFFIFNLNASVFLKSFIA